MDRTARIDPIFAKDGRHLHQGTGTLSDLASMTLTIDR